MMTMMHSSRCEDCRWVVCLISNICRSFPLGHFFKKELLVLLFVTDIFPYLIEDVNLRMPSSIELALY